MISNPIFPMNCLHRVSLQELQENMISSAFTHRLQKDLLYMIDEIYLKMKKNFYFIQYRKGKNLKTSALVNTYINQVK